jgi:mono/diheme cytochrome c family protein
VNRAVWALGFRDPHTAVINPSTGELWMAENVPQGGDEINVMRKGKDYGFGVISYGRQNSGAMINGGKTAQEGMEQPLYYWNPSIAPSGMAFYTGSKFPAWKNNIFVTALSGMQLTRLVMSGEHVVGEEKLLMDRCQRYKSVQQGPDGNLYILTDQAPPVENEILRIVPARSIPAPKIPTPGAAPLATSQTGVPGAPGGPGGSAGGRPAASPAAPTATPPTQLASAPAEASLGQAAFARVCAGCHGADGKGSLGPNIAGRTDVPEITSTVREGAGSMPALASALSATEIDAVARYLARLPR